MKAAIYSLMTILILGSLSLARAWQGTQLNALVWSPDGTQLATARADGSIQILEAESSTVLQVLKGHTGSVVSIDWRGGRIASGGLDNQIRVWNASTGEQEQGYDEHSDDVWNLLWSPNAEWLASVSGNGELGLWGEGSRLIQGAHPRAIYALAWNPDGQEVATASYDGQIKIWDLQGNLRQTLDSQIMQINVLGWGKRLVVAGEANTLEIWNLENLDAIQVPLSAPVYSFSFHPDGVRFALGDRSGRVSLYNIGGELLKDWQEHNNTITSLAFSPDGTRLASSSQQIKIWAVD